MEKSFNILKNIEELKLELDDTNIEKLETLKIIQAILKMKKLSCLMFYMDDYVNYWITDYD